MPFLRAWMRATAGCLLFALMTFSHESPASAAPIKKTIKRPKWIREGQPFLVLNGYVVALGKTVTPPGAGTEEGYIIAANAARETACKAIEHRVDFVFQDSEEGSSVDHKVLKSITTDICKWFSLNSKRGQRYWEKVATTASNGDRVLVYHVFVTEVVKENEFQKAVTKIIKKEEKSGTVDSGRAEDVKKRWKQFALGE